MSAKETADGAESLGRVVLITMHYWPEPIANGPVLKNQNEVIADLGYDVSVVAPRPFYPAARVFDEYRDGSRDHEYHGKVEVNRVFGEDVQFGSMKARIAAELKFSRNAYSFLKSRPAPKAIFTLVPSILSVLKGNRLARRFGSRHIAIVHDIQSGLAKATGQAKFGPLVWLMQTVERYALNQVDHIITLSAGMVEELRGLGVTTEMTILPPMVDEDAITPQPERDGPPCVVYSGNMGRKQGLNLLVDMAKLLDASGSPSRVILRGAGVMRDDLEKAAAGVENITFEGFAPEEQFAESLAAGHVFLVPQDEAGANFAVPSKIYTLMAAGRPFVGTAAPGSPLDIECQQSGAFLVSRPGDAEDLARQVQRLIDDPALRAELGANGRRYVEARVGRAAQKTTLAAIIEGEAVATPH